MAKRAGNTWVVFLVVMLVALLVMGFAFATGMLSLPQTDPETEEPVPDKRSFLDILTNPINGDDTNGMLPGGGGGISILGFHINPFKKKK